MFVLGTAGHIDHGKSVLVHALTGIDPDRLSEEKARGMTIDLGFAWVRLPSGREVGIVDVPGHERFVKNMLAGVGGIDLALLVVAANESVMPQTREHLAILDLLGVSRGVAVITKKDLVDDEWLGLVRMEVEELLAPTVLAGSPIVVVSALTREGLPELAATIDRMLAETPARKEAKRARMPVDRVFTMAGAGTVVTGTLLDGSLSVGDDVEIVPAAVKSRLRGLQVHKSRVETAEPGSRVAANLVGVTTSQLQRGDVLVRPGWLKPTRMLSARFRLLDYVRRPVKHNAKLSFYTGAAEAVVRIRLLEGDEMKPGETAWVQLLLDRPVATVNGDHFIIRSTTDTLGGGRIVDGHARQLRRFRAAVLEGLKVKEGGSTEDIVLALLDGSRPAPASTVSEQSGLPGAEVQAAIDALIDQGKVVRVGQREDGAVLTQAGWERLADRATGLVRDYHSRYPTRPGIPRVELANKIASKAHSQAILAGLVGQGVVVEEGLSVRLPGHQVQLTAAQQDRMAAFLKSLEENPYMSPGDLVPEPDVLNLLIERREVVKVTEGVVFSTAAYNEMVETVTAHIRTHDKVSLAEVRDMFGTSRKYAQALLEHLDSRKVTRRVGDERVLY